MKISKVPSTKNRAHCKYFITLMHFAKVISYIRLLQTPFLSARIVL